MFKGFHILYFLVGRGRNKFGLPLGSCFKGRGAVPLLLLIPSPPIKSWAMVTANRDSISAEAGSMSSFLTSNLE